MSNSKRNTIELSEYWLSTQLRMECNENNTLSILEWWITLIDSDTLFNEKQVLKERVNESNDKTVI